MLVYVHMGGDCSKKRGFPEEHNKLKGLLDPLHQHGFATRPRSGAERVSVLDCIQPQYVYSVMLKSSVHHTMPAAHAEHTFSRLPSVNALDHLTHFCRLALYM